MLPDREKPYAAVPSIFVRAKGRKRPKLPWLVSLPLLWIALAEPLRMLGVQGPVAAVFAAVVVSFVPAFLFVGRGPRARGLAVPVAILLAFLLWSLTVSVSHGLTHEGLQNLSIYGAYVSVVVLTSVSFRSLEPGHLLRRVRLLALIGTAPAFFIGLITSGFTQRFIGTGALPAIAAIGLISCAVMSNSRTNLLCTFFFIVVIFISLSRAYIVFAALALALPGVRHASDRIFGRMVARLLALGVLAFLAMTQYPPLRDRFLVNDGVSIGGVDIGTSGRDALWEVMISEFQSINQLVGAGAGRSEVLISRTFGYITQPHNDYLRLAVDFGLVGVGLWVAALVLFLVRAGRAVRASGDVDEVRLHLAAILALLFILASSFLDNVIVYVFLMIPLAVIIGASVSKQNRQIT